MNLVLRPVIFSDLEFYTKLYSELHEYLIDDHPLTLEEIKDLFKNTEIENYIIGDKEDIGIIQIYKNKPHDNACKIVNLIDKKYRNESYILRTFNLFIPTLFQDINIYRVYISVLENSMLEFNIYRKLGFKICEWKNLMSKRVSGWLGGFIMDLSYRDWLDAKV